MTEFVLTGLMECPELQVPLFLVFLVIYLITMVGNLGLTALIWKDSHIHIIPVTHSSDVWLLLMHGLHPLWPPKMLVNLLSTDREIALIECFAQFYFFCSSATTECFLLLVMAYDRYVAMWNPLLYPVVMSNKLCTQFIVVTYFIGVLNSTIYVGLLIWLTFCRSNVIHYFYCEIVQLFTFLALILHLICWWFSSAQSLYKPSHLQAL